MANQSLFTSTFSHILNKILDGPFLTLSLECLTDLDVPGGVGVVVVVVDVELSFISFKYLADSSYHHHFLKFDSDDEGDDDDVKGVDLSAYILHYSHITPSFIIHLVAFVVLIIKYLLRFINPSLMIIKRHLEK